MAGIIRCRETVEKHGNKAKVIDIRGAVYHAGSGEEYPAHVIELLFPDGFASAFYETEYNDIGISFEDLDCFHDFEMGSECLDGGKHKGKANLIKPDCYKNAFIQVAPPACIIHVTSKGKGVKKFDMGENVVASPLARNREYTLDDLHCIKKPNGKYKCEGNLYFSNEDKMSGTFTRVDVAFGEKEIDAKIKENGDEIFLKKKEKDRPFDCVTKNDYRIGEGLHCFNGKRLSCSLVALP